MCKERRHIDKGFCHQADCHEDYLLEYFICLIWVSMLVLCRLVRIPQCVLKALKLVYIFSLCFAYKCLQVFRKTNTGDKDFCLWGKFPLLRRSCLSAIFVLKGWCGIRCREMTQQLTTMWVMLIFMKAETVVLLCLASNACLLLV